MSYTRLKICCIDCNTEMATTQLNKHIGSKACSKSTNIVEGKCVHCNIEMTTIPPKSRGCHVKWCSKNPKRGSGVIDKTGSANQLNTKEAIEKRRVSISKAHADGKYIKSNLSKKGVPGKKHTEETKNKISERAKASNHQRVCKRSHEFIDKLGRKFTFDSTWEDALANRLDEISIKWDRPEPIEYTSKDGKMKKYFPDFYLPDYDLYLDPKNSFCEKQQKEKLEIVKTKIKLVILRSVEECKNWNPLEESNLVPSILR